MDVFTLIGVRFCRWLALFYLIVFVNWNLWSQDPKLQGRVVDRNSEKSLSGVRITLMGSEKEVFTDVFGRFAIKLGKAGDATHCTFFLEGYKTKVFSSLNLKKGLNLGVVHMQKLARTDREEIFIPLSETDLFESEIMAGSNGFLQAGRDVFLNRAAFDFSPVFFRVRGYDNRYASVYFNGIPMNRFADGRPQWNNWGGLNDVTRNPHIYIGLDPPEYGFGALAGTSIMEVTPGTVRKGFRLTLSASNRNYASRIMGTYNSGYGKNGLGFLASVSRRGAGEGYMEGTPYNAYSALIGLAYRPIPEHEFNLLGIYASNWRGRSAALTAETLELGGRRYNPYWGIQNGQIRNSRLRYISEPMLFFKYGYSGSALKYTLALAFRKGMQYRTRLSYFNAPNPDPVYYRKLPSYYWNRSFGPNLLGAAAAQKGFETASQIDWVNIYQANRLKGSEKSAAYLLQADCSQETQFSTNSFMDWTIHRRLKLKTGLLYQQASIDNYGRLEDLLGASYHEDKDPFSNTRNDIEGNLKKGNGDRIGYDYTLNTNHWQAFLTFNGEFEMGSVYLCGLMGGTAYKRTGKFLNERYPRVPKRENSKKQFQEFGLKGGGTYQITGRHWVRGNATIEKRPPVLRNSFVNPRERYEFVKDLKSEVIQAAEVTYSLRESAISGRLTGFYTRIMDQSHVNFFFSDTGYGSAFVQEIATGLDALHKGFELGLEVDLSASVKLSAVASMGDFKYASDPDIQLYFLPGDTPGDIRQKTGNLGLGPAKLKGLNLPAGPSRAFGLGLHYRGTTYWWVGGTMNHLSGQHTAPSFLRYTRGFLIDPHTGQEVTGSIREAYPRALGQSSLPHVYLLNLTGGKSWKKGPNYISLFISIANLLDNAYLSGGYESGRNGNLRQWYEDQLSGKPSFGARFWPGIGRTFFVNLSWSFQ